MALIEVNRQHSRQRSRLNYETDFVPWMLYTDIWFRKNFTGKFHQLLRNCKQHTELHMKRWSRKTEIFSWKTLNLDFIYNFY